MKNPENNMSKSSRLLRTIVLLAGAVGSIGLLFNKSQHPPFLLLVLFIGWVLSPFMGLLVAIMLSKCWSDLTCATLHWLILIIPPVSLVAYTGVFTPPETRPAAIFLIVPLISLLLMAITIPIAEWLSRKRSSRSDG